MISGYDYFIIGFYLLFILATGLIFRRLSKNTSDYFRAGGAMPWWITGASAWIAGFSAWTFTGAAGKIYETGTLVLFVYYGSIVGFAIVLVYSCVRFRRMRVVTWMEAVRLRYGPRTEQFYTWLKLPLLLFLGGIGLNAIGVFMSSVFQVDMTTTLIVLGTVITVVAFAGGAWAILASDFVQMIMVVTITLVVAYLALEQPAVGGLGGLLERVPKAHFSWTELALPAVITAWGLAVTWQKILDTNSIEASTMYLMSRSDRDARRMVAIPLIGGLIGPLIWLIPPMAATITHPNLAAEYANLKAPHEAAFVAVCMDVLPKGLLGLLLCAMLGATLTSMDAGLNKGVGVFVRSLYLPVIRPRASEKHLLIVSKLATLTFGAIIVSLAVVVSKVRTVGLFDLSNQIAASLIAPLALPLVFGFFYKKTPPWSAWTTAVIAFVVAWVVKFNVTPEHYQWLLGAPRPLTGQEVTDMLLAATVFGTLLVGGGWFFLTSLFYKSSPAEYRAQVEEFFERLRTPVEKHGVADLQEAVYHRLGVLCLVFGSFVLLLTLIPNSLQGRMCFVFVGGIIAGIGGLLYWRSKRLEIHITEQPELVAGGDDRTMPHPPTQPAALS
jgi:Na+/proline symporter